MKVAGCRLQVAGGRLGLAGRRSGMCFQSPVDLGWFRGWSGSRHVTGPPSEPGHSPDGQIRAGAPRPLLVTVVPRYLPTSYLPPTRYLLGGR